MALIMIVDDSPTEVHVLKTALEKHGFDTVSAADGEKLLREPPVPGLAKIGECVEAGLWLETGGTRRPLRPTGWVHPVG